MPKTTVSIAIEVAPAVFARWASALQRLSRQLKIDVVENLPGPVVIGAPSFTCTGLEYLLRLGLAGGRPERPDEPAGLFGLFRYATTLAPTGSALTIDRTLEIDTHKKKVMSDEFGCAMALVVADRFLDARLTIDVDLAIARGWLKTQAPTSRRPDYMAIRRGTPRTLGIIEAKGSQQSASYSRWQLTSGCDQIAKVEVDKSPYSISTRIVTATLLRWEGQGTTALYVGDPERDAEPDTYEFAVHPLECAFRDHYLRAASLAGAANVIRQLAMDERSAPDSLVARQIRGNEYFGSEIRAVSGDRSLGLFFGIRLDVLDILRRVRDVAEIEHFIEATVEQGLSTETVTDGAHQATLGGDGTAIVVALPDTFTVQA